jgi:hypothetical protein
MEEIGSPRHLEEPRGVLDLLMQTRRSLRYSFLD